MTTSDSAFERGTELLQRFVRDRDDDDLDAAVAAFEAAVLDTAEDDATRPIVVGGLARALRTRFHVRPTYDADRAVELLEEVLGRPGPDDEVRASTLEDLASTLGARHSATGDADDLTGRIDALRAALACTRDDARAFRLRTRLAVSLYDEHAAGGPDDLLDEAIDLFEVALGQGRGDDGAFVSLVSNLGVAREVRFDRHGSDVDLSRAIDVYELGLAVDGVAPARRAGLTNNVAGALKKRYLKSGYPDDLRDCISYYEESEAAAAGSPHLPAIRSNLASALGLRYQRSGDRDDLDRAQRLLVESLESADSDDVRADRLSNLGNILTALFSATGELTFAQQAEHRHAEALRLTPVGSRSRPRYLTNMAGTVRLLFDRTGDERLLERSIDHHQQAVDAAESNAPDSAAMWSNLAVALRERYGLEGDASDLDRAVQLLESAVQRERDHWPHAQDYSPRLAELSGNLASALAERADRDERPADLDRAIDLFTSAAEALPPGSPARTGHLVNRALGLQDRYRRDRHADDLDGALELIESALGDTDAGAGTALLWNLRGNGLLDRYERDRAGADLDGALASYRTAATMPAGAADRARILSNLGQALRTNDDHAPGAGAQADAIDAYREACATAEDAAPAVALACGREWGGWAMDRAAWDEATEALGYAAEAASRGFLAQTLRRHKEAWLENARGVNTALAYARARDGDLEGAVVAAEEGRARLLGEALELDRRDLESVVGTAHRDHVERFRRAALHFRDLQQRGLSERFEEPRRGHRVEPDEDLSPRSLRDARRSLDDAKAELRRVPGLRTFMAPARFEDVVARADHPLVYLIAAGPGGVALIVSSDGSVRSRPLPQLTEPEVRSRAERMTGASERDAGWPAMLDDITSWLWSAAMGPVVDELTGRHLATVVATGTLGMLPLHAAWEHSDDQPTGRRYALDELAVDFAPSATSRGPASDRSDGGRARSLAAVLNPPSSGEAPLTYAGHELDIATRAFPEPDVLPGAEGTEAAVVDLLDIGADVVHFGCHGRADAATPLENCLLLAGDDRLTVGDLLTGPRRSSRLAVLSACDTARVGLALPDEVVGLPTGFLEAGFGGVVASMWKVIDESTALVMLRFYDEWTRTLAPPAVALAAAQRWVRDTTNGAKATWLHDEALDNRSEGLPYDGLNKLYQDIGLQDGDRRGHAGPDHWAAFACFGK